MTIRRGDVFRHELAGGGGWGDPLERDPERVLADVRDELIAADLARAAYGVAIDRASWTVDQVATRNLRAELRGARGPGPLPKIARVPSAAPLRERTS
jgi:N-methylhydantoinase B